VEATTLKRTIRKAITFLMLKLHIWSIDAKPQQSLEITEHNQNHGNRSSSAFVIVIQPYTPYSIQGGFGLFLNSSASETMLRGHNRSL